MAIALLRPEPPVCDCLEPLPPGFLSAADLDPAGWHGLLALSARLKAEWRLRRAHPTRPLRGRSAALLFEHPSLRTRTTFELAVRQLGGEAVHLAGAEVGLGMRESVGDVGRTLGRWVDVIVARTRRDATLRELAASAGVPVVNALTDREHPCQALADLLTIQERTGGVAGRTVVFIGDGNNVAASLAIAGVSLGATVRVVTPPGHELPEPVVQEAVAREREAGGRLELWHGPQAAVVDADVVYTDAWTSMGQEDERQDRLRTFAHYRVDERLLAAAPDHAVVLHCLPAHRGEEISDAVLDGVQSAAWQQAENRLHSAKAVLVGLLA
ncbi:MAG TPA: ornithine carbamoyltransferase [Candidatus Limnocylindrales bacterium]|nr:ornithine carbamoyltransferase [Candidatus Limnocylindrales bacterium]